MATAVMRPNEAALTPSRKAAAHHELGIKESQKSIATAEEGSPNFEEGEEAGGLTKHYGTARKRCEWHFEQ